jgi:hypothetical protein
MGEGVPLIAPGVADGLGEGDVEPDGDGDARWVGFGVGDLPGVGVEVGDLIV